MRGILVVDDEPSMRELLGILLQQDGYEVTAVGSRAEAQRVLAQDPPALVITDLKLPDGDGLEILKEARASSPETAVIIMTAYGSTQTAVAALKLGAVDYLVKPFDTDELRIVVRGALEKRRLEEENLLLKAEFRAQHGLEHIVGSSSAMRSVFEMLRAVAPTQSTVLISGESGTGKELVARALHTLSARKDEAFVSVNCGALPEGLLESELFGHVKGAFTDAHQNRKGLFEAAHRGTLFLDEVGETTPSMQVKLLRALQERRIRRVGGTEEIEADARVIAATNRPLDTLVKEGRLREDLFYRLNVIPIHLPPLRERREDIPILAEHFFRAFNREMGKKLSGIARDAMERLIGYHWPGNVRELENVLERAVALETSKFVRPDWLPELPASYPAMPALELSAGFDLNQYLREREGQLLRSALERSAGDRQAAASLLGITTRALRYLVLKHGHATQGGKV